MVGTTATAATQLSTQCSICGRERCHCVQHYEEGRTQWHAIKIGGWFDKLSVVGLGWAQLAPVSGETMTAAAHTYSGGAKRRCQGGGWQVELPKRNIRWPRGTPTSTVQGLRSWYSFDRPPSASAVGHETILGGMGGGCASTGGGVLIVSRGNGYRNRRPNILFHPSMLRHCQSHC